MKVKSRLGFFVLIATLSLWGYFLFFVPTFDFDESLYRRVADNMKASGNIWNLTWDGDPLYHKPPIFYWLVCIFSYLLDGGTAPVSALAARLPSFFSSVGILSTLFFGIQYVKGEKLSFTEKLSPALLFLCAAFPLFTATGVVFDPLQTLTLMPALLVMTKRFLRDEQLVLKEWLWVAGSLFLASATKGLNGIIIPSFAFALQLLWVTLKNKKSARSFFNESFCYLGFAFLPAAILTALYYILLHHKIGPAFTEEFIWVQHLGRSTHAMEAHGGSVFYHPLVLFFGGGFFTPLFFYTLKRTKLDWVKLGFPIAYAFSFVTIFSFSATKLPHYTWPVWPALALFLALVTIHEERTASENIPESRSARRMGFITSFPVFVFSVVLIFLASRPEDILRMQNLGPMAESYLRHFSGFSYFERTLLYLGGVIGMVFQIRRASLTRSIFNTSVFASLVYLCFAFGALRPIRELLVQPYFAIAEDLRALQPKKSECIRYSGALSPTLSIALGRELVHNRCYPFDMKYLIATEWKAKECQEQRMNIVSNHSYLYLCTKK